MGDVTGTVECRSYRRSLATRRARERLGVLVPLQPVDLGVALFGTLPEFLDFGHFLGRPSLLGGAQANRTVL